MFEKLKQLFNSNKEATTKEVIICIHGFGKRTIHEYDSFLLWNNNEREMITFPIFDGQNESDTNALEWIERCEKVVKQYIDEQYKVFLVGFSMGGVLASHCASKFPVERLFLVSPAFDYLHVGNLVNTAVQLLKKEEPKRHSLSVAHTQCFMEVVKLCKESIANVPCAVCFVHGDKDEVIPLRSSLNAYEKIKHPRKRLFIIHEGKHGMIMRENSAWETYQLLQLFINGILLGATPISFAKDILEEDTSAFEKND